MSFSLYYVTRQNVIRPELRERWEDFYLRVVLPGVVQRDGVLRGARYKLAKGPLYVGWPGPAQAYEYLNIFELEDTPEAMDSALRPPSRISFLSQWPGSDSPIALLNHVRAAYRRFQGELDFAPLIYVARYNWLAAEREEEWNQFYDRVVMPSVLRRPGHVRGSRYTIARGPIYENWSGPSRCYRYMNIYELEDTPEALEAALPPVGQIGFLKEWPPGDKPIVEMVNEVRAVYRLVAEMARP